MGLHPARRLWHSMETIYQPALSVDATRIAGKELGLRGFWMTLMAFRSAPLGAVDAATVVAVFGGFAPEMVGKAIPAAWSLASPATCLEHRRALAGDLLRQAGVTEALAAPLVERMSGLAEALEPTGRPLGAANAALPLVEDPVVALWQLASTIREYRGDGHLTAWVAAGVTGLEAHHLLVAGTDQHDTMRELRGWSPQQWSAAAESLAARGLLETDSGALTARGRTVRDEVERQTDELSWSGGLSVLGDDEVSDICAALAPLVGSVRSAGMAPLFPLLAGRDAVDPVQSTV